MRQLKINLSCSSLLPPLKKMDFDIDDYEIIEETVKINKITTQPQFQCLLQLMQENEHIARGSFKFGSSKAATKVLWNEFAGAINKLGPPVRNGEGWLKVWNDWKFKIRKKLAINKKEIKSTGGGTFRQICFSNLEEGVIDLLCLKKVASPSGYTFGFQEEGNVSPNFQPKATPVKKTFSKSLLQKNLNFEKENIESNNLENSTTILEAAQRDGEKDNNFERLNILQNQTKTQDEIKTILQSIEKECSEQTRYTRKCYELKKEKLKILKDDMIKQDNYRRRKIRVIEMKAEIAQKKLDLDSLRMNNEYSAE